jgi:D-3-phosphoglycerate dehydrogenase
MKVFIPQQVAEPGVELLKSHGFEVVSGEGLPQEEWIKLVRDCDAALVRTAKFGKDLLESGTKLKIVARHGVGYDNIDITTAEQRGIWVTNTPLALSDSVAEFTLAILLLSGKRIMQCSLAMRDGDYKYKNSHKGVDIAGKTLGILGFGRIGRALAEKAHFGLSMNIIAYSPSLTQDKAPDYVKVVPRDDIFKLSDFVSIHIPGGVKNRNSIGAREFGLMKPTAILLNVARGEVLDETALDAALRNHELAFAVLDVQKEEPPSADWPLYKNENVIATPHMGSNTLECMDRMALHAAQQIVKVLEGGLPDWPVNHPVFK